VETLPNVLPITPGLLGLMPGGTPRTGAVEPPAPPTDALVRIDFPYYRPPVRPWYPPISGGTGGSPNGQQVPPFGPPPIYVMPPVWAGTPYRPWPPYGGVLLPPIPPGPAGAVCPCVILRYSTARYLAALRHHKPLHRHHQSRSHHHRHLNRNR
jgi:hypothetical protein